MEELIKKLIVLFPEELEIRIYRQHDGNYWTFKVDFAGSAAEFIKECVREYSFELLKIYGKI